MPAAMAKVKNTNKVSSRMWSNWRDDQRRLFNATHDEIMRLGPTLMLHPNNVQMPHEEFSTIAWNAAFIAADQLHERTYLEVVA